MPKIAVLQMTSGIDPEANLRVIEEAIKKAAIAGARTLFTPEMSILLDRDRKRASNWVGSAKEAKAIEHLGYLAFAHNIDLALGSTATIGTEGELVNRSMYFEWVLGIDYPQYYDKIHMFDVELATGEIWRESSAYRAGEKVTTIEQTALGRLGLTICYDLRFPALFDELGKRRCDAIAVPAAFTVPTGQAHWHVLLRARAIEASAFVIAAAQVGKHEDGRETYGHSLVVDPWGEVLLDMGGDEPGLGFCDIDLNRIEEVRSQIPSLANRREMPN